MPWRRWIEVINLSGRQYSVNKDVRFKTYKLRSDLCDYSDAYIAVKGAITVEGVDDANKRNKYLNFKNNLSFLSYISNIN